MPRGKMASVAGSVGAVPENREIAMSQQGHRATRARRGDGGSTRKRGRKPYNRTVLIVLLPLYPDMYISVRGCVKLTLAAKGSHDSRNLTARKLLFCVYQFRRHKGDQFIRRPKKASRLFMERGDGSKT